MEAEIFQGYDGCGLGGGRDIGGIGNGWGEGSLKLVWEKRERIFHCVERERNKNFFLINPLK